MEYGSTFLFGAFPPGTYVEAPTGTSTETSAERSAETPEPHWPARLVPLGGAGLPES